MKKAIIIIIAVLVLVLGTCTCLYFFTDVFNFLKPTSDNFSIQAKKLFGAKEESSYSDYLKSIEGFKLQDNDQPSYTSEGEVSLNVTLPSSVMDYSTQRILNNSSVKWSGSYDANSKAASTNVGLSFNKKELINLNAITKGSTISINSSDLYDKTLNFDLSKFEEFCKRNNIELDEEAINTIKKASDTSSQSNANMLYDLLYLTEDEYKALHKNYGNLLTTLIDEDKYSSKKNQKITIDDEEIKTTAYSLTLSGKDVYNYINKLANQSKNDSTLKDIIIKKYDVLKKYMANYSDIAELEDSDLTMPEKITNSDIEKAFDELIKELEDSKDSFSDIKYSLKMTIYADKKQEPVRFTMALVKGEDDEGSVFFTEDVEDGKNTYTIDLKELSKKLDNSSSKSDDDDYSSIYSSSKSNSISSVADSLSKIIIVDEYEKTDTSRKGKITISAKTSSGKQDIATIEYDKVFSDNEVKNNITLSSSLLSSMSFKLEFSTTGLKEDTQKVVFNVSGKIPVGYSSYQFDLKANGSVTRGKSDVKEASDAVEVFDLSTEEFAKLYNDIVTNASNNLPSKLSNFGLKVTKDDILSEFPLIDVTSNTDNGEAPVEETAENPAA